MTSRAIWLEDDGLAPLRFVAPWIAALLLCIVAALVVVGVGLELQTKPGATSDRKGADAALYGRIVQDVSAGEPYYPAAALELRRGGFPLRPFMAIRPPLLAVALARLPGEALRRGALDALAAITFSAWAWRLRGTGSARPWRYAGLLLLLGSGIAPALASSAYLFHEVWAGLLIACSMALHQPRRWAASLALGLAAALGRELAAPYLVVMGLFALIEGRRGEAAAWAGALAVFALALSSHAIAASAVATGADARSPGWLGLGGWRFVLATLQWNPVLMSGSDWKSALLFPPALLGLVFWPGALGRRVAALVLGYVGGLCVVGRPDNAYWGLLITPVWPLGLAFTGVAARALLARCGLHRFNIFAETPDAVRSR